IAARSDNVYEMIRHGHMLATISSNTAIESAICHKPLLVLQPSIPYDFDHHNNAFNAFLAKGKAGQVIRNAREWYAALKLFYRRASYRKHLVRKGQLFLGKTLLTRGNAKTLIGRQIV